MTNPTAALLDRLIAELTDWDTNGEYYRRVVIPQIVTGRGRVPFKPHVKQLVGQLRNDLTLAELEQLETLIERRRQGEPVDLTYDKRLRRIQRRKAEEAERRDQEQLAAERERDRKVSLFARGLQAQMDADFLGVEEFWKNHVDSSLVTPDYLRAEKRAYVQAWARRTLPEDSSELDNEQADAVAQTHGHVQVVARAGSGKTRVITTRAIFLQKHCGVKPNEMLLLAFNKKAAEEMRERIREHVGDHVPHVMTFHALAYAIVQHNGRILHDDTRAGAELGQLGLSRAIQAVIDDHVHSEEHGPRIRSFMLQHFREDWESIANGRFHVPMQEFLDYRRSLSRETLGGEYVKSFGERVIANALFEHDIDYRYEPALRWGDSTYHPDFTIALPDGKRRVVVEYFGMAGDADYDVQSEEKRRFLATKHPDWPVIERSASDLAKSEVLAFVEDLLVELRNAGVPVRRLSEEEIWQRCAGRPIDNFTRLTKQFIGRCRLEDLSPDELVDRTRTHNPITESERGFLEVVPSIYDDYIKANKRLEEQDFAGLLWEAVRRIETSSTFVRDKGRERGDLETIRYLFVDEFQDFSAPFYHLVDSVRSVNPEVQLFAVGDDWQAINGFAGSELKYIEHFSDFFPSPRCLTLRSNYRSGEAIVRAGNQLMKGMGIPAKHGSRDPGRAVLYDLSSFELAPVELVQKIRADLAAYGRICINLLNSGNDVVLLGRRASDWTYVLEQVRQLLPEPDRRRVVGETIHGFKGKEAEAVVLVGVTEMTAPLTHPHWIYGRVFGTSLASIGDEERRLFYVGLTRASRVLTIVSDGIHRSPFVEDISQSLQHGSWDQLRPVPNRDTEPCVEVRAVGNTRPIREYPKRQGFQWMPKGQYWWKRYPAASFSEDQIRGQAWANALGVRIEFLYDEGARDLVAPTTDAGTPPEWR